MTTSCNMNIVIDERAHSYAKIYSSLVRDHYQRKRAFASISALYAFLEMIKDFPVDVQKSMTLFRNPILNEHYEINDIYVNGWHLDVRVVTGGDAVLVPKVHYECKIVPDFYVVIKIDKTLKNAEFIGIADTSSTKPVAYDFHYSCIPFSKLITIDEFIEKVKSNKEISYSEEDHELFRSSYLALMDDELDKQTKNKILKHLFNCSDCRTEFCCFTGFEMVCCNAAQYPELFEDQTLNIIGANYTDNEKYEGKEETIYFDNQNKEIVETEPVVNNSNIKSNSNPEPEDSNETEKNNNVINIELENNNTENNDNVINIELESNNSIESNDNDSIIDIDLENNNSTENNNIETNEVEEDSNNDDFLDELFGDEDSENDKSTEQETNSQSDNIDDFFSEENNNTHSNDIDDFFNDANEKEASNIGTSNEIIAEDENKEASTIEIVDNINIETSNETIAKDENKEASTIEIVDNINIETSNETIIEDENEEAVSIVLADDTNIETVDETKNEELEDDEHFEDNIDSNEQLDNIIDETPEIILEEEPDIIIKDDDETVNKRSPEDHVIEMQDQNTQKVIVDYDDKGQPVYSYITNIDHDMSDIISDEHEQDEADQEYLKNHASNPSPSQKEEDATVLPFVPVQKIYIEDIPNLMNLEKNKTTSTKQESIENKDKNLNSKDEIKEEEIKIEENTPDENIEDEDIIIKSEENEEFDEVNRDKEDSEEFDDEEEYDDVEDSEEFDDEEEYDDEDDSEEFDDEEEYDDENDSEDNSAAEYEEDDDNSKDNEELIEEEEENSENKAKKKKSASKIIAVTVSAFILIISISIGLYMLTKKDNNEDVSNSIGVQNTELDNQNKEEEFVIADNNNEQNNEISANENNNQTQEQNINENNQEDITIQEENNTQTDVKVVENPEIKNNLTEQDLTVPEQKIQPKTDASRTIASAFSNGFNAVSIRNINWYFDTSQLNDIVNDNDFNTFLKEFHNDFEQRLKKNLVSIVEVPPKNSVTAKFAVDKNGKVVKSVITNSCGSKEIDNIVLQSIKETSNREKSQIISGNSQLKAEFYYLTVVIKF